METFGVFILSCFILSCICILIGISQRKHQKWWYVRYPTGYRTHLMSRCEAHEYGDIFGGVVHKEGQEKLPEVYKSVASSRLR